MSDLTGNLVTLAILVCLPAIGLVFGKIDEKKHYRTIIDREKKYSHILLFNEKCPPVTVSGHDFCLVTGSVVVSGDYFKTMVASLKQFFGGRLTSFESILDRGRRESLLRMKEEAASCGATMIFNVHFQTTALGTSSMACAEFLAYGTAVTKP